MERCPGTAPTRSALGEARIAKCSDISSLSVVAVQWHSRRTWLLHATVFLVVVACFALGWWQLLRALSGNTLSWVYTFEWPFFAGYAVYMWWKLLHEQADGDGQEPGKRHDAADSADEEDEELAEYNRYLADLHASDRPRRN
jgi:hypothetical protein